MRFLSLALSLICVIASAQNINEQPLYGGRSKSPEMIKTDQRLIEAAVKAAGSKEAAAKQAITRGWQYLNQGNTGMAIKRFNQAYLLTPNSAYVYWGLGAASVQQGKFDEGIKLFNRAYALDPKNVRLVADIGMARTRYALSASDPGLRAKRLQASLLWLDAAEKLDPSYPLTHANRAIAFYHLGQYAKAWTYIGKAEAIDRNSVDRALLNDLSRKYPRPATRAAASSAAQAAVQTAALPEAAQAPAKKSALAGGRMRSASARQDLRHCLKLATNTAIAKCVYAPK
ncbi:MAG: tetratricopeptide repeat protein [Burkholderiaceae bacterium]|nr:tetratricopeptide repeat protein [Burkholderiaceae bacterium]